MSLVSTEEYLRKGHQVDLDMMNLDSLITGLNQENAVPVGDLTTWYALKAEWDNFYHQNIENVPALPWQSTSDIDTWITRWQAWQAKANGWAASSSPRAKAIARDLPESPAIIQKKEDDIAGNKPSVTPTWVYMLFAVGLLGAVGYAGGAVARLTGK